MKLEAALRKIRRDSNKEGHILHAVKLAATSDTAKFIGKIALLAVTAGVSSHAAAQRGFRIGFDSGYCLGELKGFYMGDNAAAGVRWL